MVVGSYGDEILEARLPHEPGVHKLMHDLGLQDSEIDVQQYLYVKYNPKCHKTKSEGASYLRFWLAVSSCFVFCYFPHVFVSFNLQQQQPYRRNNFLVGCYF